MRSLALAAVLLVPMALTAADEPKGKVKVTKGIAYVEGPDADKERHVLDLYLPEGVKDYPVLFYVHGGGWTKGSKESFAAQGELFAKYGIGVVTINHRLTPAVQHPGHIQDVAKAFAWTHANIGKHGGRADRIFVSGHSAGGHLVALLATDASHLEVHKLGLKDIRGCIPISGVFRISDKQTKAFGDADNRKKASPLTHANGTRPPFLCLYADGEAKLFGDQATALVGALVKAGNKAKVERIAKRDHGSIMREIRNVGDPAGKLMLAFIREHGK